MGLKRGIFHTGKFFLVWLAESIQLEEFRSQLPIEQWFVKIFASYSDTKVWSRFFYLYSCFHFSEKFILRVVTLI